MTTYLAGVVPFGLVFSNAVLRSEVFAVLAAFVAINTLIYITLAVTKILPKIYVSDWISPSNRRSQTRGIHPDHRPPP